MSIATTNEQTIPWLGLNGRLTANRWRLTLLFGLIMMFLWSPEMRDITVHALSDAYFQVTVFVAGTLALVFWFEKIFAFDLGQVMKNNLRWQPLIASALGALPGCGGAIIVVTQFTRGYASFGAFIAVLVSTMGDAAFLLMARDPKTFLLVLSISLVVGTITGFVVDKAHGRDFMAVNEKENDPAKQDPNIVKSEAVPFSNIWVSLIAISIIPAIAIAFNFEAGANAPFLGLGLGESFGTYLGFFAAIFGIALWSISKRPDTKGIGADTLPEDALITRVVKDTNFITAWVVMAFLMYEIVVVKFGLDVSVLFNGYILLLPLMGILVGFIPGCGPQVVVTSLYLVGAIPLSTQLSNAIANDGDALFPALALAPKAAILATLYSAIPAVIIGYSWLFFFEL